jgi:hypothetical protein
MKGGIDSHIWCLASQAAMLKTMAKQNHGHYNCSRERMNRGPQILLSVNSVNVMFAATQPQA